MKLILSVLFIINLSILMAQNTNCSKFRNGKFSVSDEILGISYIERKGATQIETAPDIHIKAAFKVKWINECTYTLVLKKVIENPNKIDFPKDLILTVKIIETKENSYIQETSSNKYDMVYKSEMVIMNN